MTIMPDWSRWFYDVMYRVTRPDWDTGLTPPEVVTLIEGRRDRGRALDLGCGTGTNAIYLAQHGYDVVGVDFSAKAIEQARGKARQAGVKVDYQIGDVTRLDFLHEPFDVVIDVGCFHGLDTAGQARYVQQVVRLTRTGSTLLMFAFEQPTFLGRYGLTLEAAQRIFAPHFVMSDVKHGLNRHNRSAAWYRFDRQ
jgi:SAM-dependent methyltransferase